LGHANAEIVDRIVANVNGEIVLLSDVRKQIVTLRSFIGQPGGPAQNVSEFEALRGMVDEKIILRHAKEANVAIKDSEVDQTIEGIKTGNNIDDAALEEALKSQGMKVAEYREKLKNQMVIQRVTSMEISGVNVSDDEVKSYYRRNVKDFMEPGRVRLSHIVSMAKEEESPGKAALAEAKISTALREIRAGADFAEKAKKISEDGSAEAGGDLGWFMRGKMLPVFEDTAFSMKKGEVAGPIRTQHGFHIIKVTDREEPKQTPFEEVAAKIHDKLAAEAFSRKRNTWIEKLRTQAYVEYMY
jgi:parvulin-like peptidyl-prolyl isomerase